MTLHAPPKILVIYAHPDPQASLANAEMVDAIAGLPHVTIHDLYGVYPDFFIDVTREHALLAQHDIFVFQHPLYMYSCPALLKEWIDVVLGKGYAHGEGNALQGKYWRSVISTGGAAEAYTPDGYNRANIDAILKPFELTAALCQMQWLPPLVLHWARRIPALERQQHAKLYHDWLINPMAVIHSEVAHGE
ncbi:glutathione-regulated potassium-efflux system ancillary protein KefG [Photobacterium sanguinicancri]|uniref:glutathione-regulated potassium-efflux system ancillary protein KefG n=1 Tax=Photobacterium sanguinicancri TaxID=875932 RepID=UPI0021C2E07B|nr:glutathione-regulated potassium-efflux system ancillary protein KefG [Photobacterium sanguinicancri]